VDSPEAFADLLASEAAHVTQTSIIGYCHARTLLPFSELTREKLFRDAYTAARWQVFAAVLADLVVFSEGILRPAAAGREDELARRLATLYSETLADTPGIPGAADRAADVWAAASRELASRLERTALALPLEMRDITARSARRMFELMPIHESMKLADEESIIAGVGFKMAAVAGRLRDRLDAPSIVAGLFSGSAAGHGRLARDDNDGLNRIARGTP